MIIKYRSLFVCSLVMSLSGCVASGFKEFQQYSEAYDQQYIHADVVLTALAAAERKVFLRVTAPTVDAKPFNPDDAAYYVAGVEPPLTASLRGSLKALKDYNAALAALGNGESAEALTNRMAVLTTNAITTVAVAEAALAAPADPATASAIAGPAANFLADALPFFRAVAGAASREAFRKNLIGAYPTMRKLLVGMRGGTPKVFILLERGGMDPAKNRELLAGWVLLLDQSIVSLDAAKKAAESDTPLSLANLSAASIEMRVLAEKVKSARAD